MDEPSAHTGNFVGADGCPHAAAAERHSAINCASGYGPGQWDNVIRVVVSGAQMERTEVDDLMSPHRAANSRSALSERTLHGPMRFLRA
jgi:hypothetical protein